MIDQAIVKQFTKIVYSALEGFRGKHPTPAEVTTTIAAALAPIRSEHPELQGIEISASVAETGAVTISFGSEETEKNISLWRLVMASWIQVLLDRQMFIAGLAGGYKRRAEDLQAKVVAAPGTYHKTGGPSLLLTKDEHGRSIIEIDSIPGSPGPHRWHFDADGINIIIVH